MKVASINNTNVKNSPNFGHSFRVNICLEDEDGIKHVNPNSDSQLYKNLNSKLVGWLNEDYIQSVRDVYGITRKTGKSKSYGDLHKSLVKDLKEKDIDYRKLGLARSVYRKNKLGYIATGTDVVVLENFYGGKDIGKAKSGRYGFHNIPNLVKRVKSEMLDYVKSSDVLLRSKNNKEIMLKTVFKQVGTSSKGSPIYELSDYEFHENKSLPTLPPISQQFIDFKNSPQVENAIDATIRHQKENMLKKH